MKRPLKRPLKRIKARLKARAARAKAKGHGAVAYRDNLRAKVLEALAS